MKLRNKKTGEIVKFETTIYADTEDKTYEFNSIAELNEEWEDYEEPKEYWFIRDYSLSVGYAPADNNATAKFRKEIVGNYFETKEEAEKTLEKIKAWKRLRDKGFKFKTWGWENKDRYTDYCIWFTLDNKDNTAKDLDLLFGGEE